jgi:hypothetical protein
MTMIYDTSLEGFIVYVKPYFRELLFIYFRFQKLGGGFFKFNIFFFFFYINMKKERKKRRDIGI